MATDKKMACIDFDINKLLKMQFIIVFFIVISQNLGLF